MREWSNKVMSVFDWGMAVLWRFLEGGQLRLYPDGDFCNGSVTWSVVADVARLPRAVFLRDNESEVESSGGCGEAPAHCVIAVATERQPV